jgi:hypothetical protein
MEVIAKIQVGQAATRRQTEQTDQVVSPVWKVVEKHYLHG